MRLQKITHCHPLTPVSDRWLAILHFLRWRRSLTGVRWGLSILHITCFALFLFTTSLHAQTSFSASPQLVTAIKPADLFVFYNYSDLTNLTDDTLHLRWVKVSETLNFAGPPGDDGYGDWKTAVQDPTNYYTMANTLDSAEFYLTPEASYTNKFIFQLFPNGQTGSLNIRYKIYAVDDPADSLIIVFNYSVTAPATAVREAVWANNLQVYPNPASDWFRVVNGSPENLHVTTCDMNGKVWQTFSLPAHQSLQENCSELPPGMYLLQFEKDGQKVVKKLLKP